MRSLLLAAVLLTGCYGVAIPQDDAIVHTDRIGYTHAYWHDPTITAAHTSRAVPLASIVPAGAVLVDLTHAFDGDTLYWPGDRGRFVREAARRQGGELDMLASARLSAPELGGTHLGAPAHHAVGGQTTDRVPLPRLMARVVVIDMSAKAAANPDALLEPADFEAFEAKHGIVEPGTIVMVRTDWSKRWPDPRRYLGDDRPGATDKLHFPGIAPEAAALLVARDVAAVGIDTASVDHGPSQSFASHRALAEADIPTFENVTRLDAVPTTGAVVIALPMKIGGGAGAPLRIVAVVPR